MSTAVGVVGGIVLVMGLPAAGKTTLCKALAANKTASLWSLDEYPDAEKLRIKNDMIFESVSDALIKNPTSIHIIDDTFHLKSMRKRYVMLAREQRLGLAIVHLEAPLELLLQRNTRRNCRVDDSVILKMAASFEPLCQSHQFHLVQPTLEVLWKEIMDKLVWSQTRHCEIDQINEAESQNRAHKLCLLLNQAVSIIMRNTPASKRNAMAHIVIPLKQKTFADLKSRMHVDEKVLAAIDENNASYFHSLLQDQL